MIRVRSLLFALVAMFAAVGAPMAMAATGTALDVSGVTAQLGEVETAIMAVGGGIIMLAAIAMGFKWIKGGIFG